MNTKNIQRVIDSIKNEDNGFTMSTVDFFAFDDLIPEDGKRGKCGTPACIVGWAEHHIEEDVDKGINMRQSVRDFFGITGTNEEQRMKTDKLFMPEGYSSNMEYYTRARTITTLENFRDTGEVDWNCGG